LLSFLFGIFGLDRLYLGYHSLALVKLLTGGFFFVGYLFDTVVIIVQLVGPADGRGYSVSKPFPFLMRHLHHLATDTADFLSRIKLVGRL
jgi:TM2 domain-containing membrane protein YozV